MSYPLIGLVGAKGAGKDTVGDFLARAYGYTKAAWATALKRETYVAFGHALLQELQENWRDDVLGTDFEDWLRFIDRVKYDAPDTEFGWIRPMLQFWGTEYRRKLCGDDYWIKQLTLTPQMVVTDCRFPNELQAIKDAGGVIIEVYRPSASAKAAADPHASEHAWKEAAWGAHLIYNADSLESLEHRTIALLTHLQKKAVA